MVRRAGGWRPTAPWTALAVGAVMLGLSIAVVGAVERPAQQPDGAENHEALFAEDRFPSATTCAPCHEDIYREWSVSAHAYAQMSPVFNARCAGRYEPSRAASANIRASRRSVFTRRRRSGYIGA